MIRGGRIPQTLLFSGPGGRRQSHACAAIRRGLLGHDLHKIEQDDLSLESNAALIADREKWTSDKRNEDPLVFSSHPDFTTFAPDGPLRQITIAQMRLLKERAPLKPLRGAWKVFLIDSIDRANEQAANSLLKTLEEPPPHLLLILTARNAYDLLPTIRSRAVPFYFGRLNEAQMRAFLSSHKAEPRNVDHAERRLALAEGSPGVAVSLDLEAYDRRRGAMLALLKVAGGLEPFSAWMKHSESIGARRTEKMEVYLEVLYTLLGDVARLGCGVAEVAQPGRRGRAAHDCGQGFLRVAEGGGGARGRSGGAGAAQHSEVPCTGCLRRPIALPVALCYPRVNSVRIPQGAREWTPQTVG